MFHYTIETNQSVDEAVDSLTETLKEAKFGVLWDFDAQATLEKNDFSYEPAFRILEVCSPAAAYEVLTQNQLAGYFLPCKIIITEDQGKTVIGMPKPTELMNFTGDKEVMKIAEDIEATLITSIERAAE